MKTFYRRHLPHIQPPGATLFVTFRQYGSLPRSVSEQLHQEYEHLRQEANRYVLQDTIGKEYRRIYEQQKRLFAKFDQYLDQSVGGPHFLKQAEIARLVCSTIKYWDQKRYDLLCYCVMSNHVHIVIIPLEISDGEYYLLELIMHSIKSYSATEANKILNRAGKPFWNSESFDHYSRSDEETGRIIAYVMNNPVKAGLVKSPKDWEWSYCKTGILPVGGA